MTTDSRLARQTAERLIGSRDSIGSLDARAAILTADVAAQTGRGRVRVAEAGARSHRVFIVTLAVSCIQNMFKCVVKVYFCSYN